MFVVIIKIKVSNHGYSFFQRRISNNCSQQCRIFITLKKRKWCVSHIIKKKKSGIDNNDIIPDIYNFDNNDINQFINLIQSIICLNIYKL